MPANERNTFHVLQRKAGYDPETGEPNPSYIQKYGEQEFVLFMKRELERQGWELTILYDPRVASAQVRNATPPVQQAAQPQAVPPQYVQQPPVQQPMPQPAVAANVKPAK